MLMSNESAIASFYNNKSVLITGVTGFLGKVLLEKLLRACPGLKCAYVVIRNSRGKSSSLRLSELLDSQAFDRVRHENPEALKKVVLISGDLTKPGLLMSPSEKELLAEEISIVFNLAARLKFDDQLREAIDTNIKGPLELARISRDFKNLEVFVHVSTAFCHFNAKLMDETIPKSDCHAITEFLRRVDSMTDEEYKMLARNLVSKHPNVYAYTKGLAEQLLEKESKDGLPLVIVKPSTILAAEKDPYPGWIDSLNGTNGITAGLGKGLAQVCHLDRSVLNDVVPVDYSANIAIAVAWNYVTNKKVGDGELEVYNYCSSPLNPLTFGQCIDFAVKSWRKNPTKEFLWYPSCICYRYWLPCFFSLLFNHYIPAFFIDLISQMSGKKPFLVRLYKKLDRVMEVMIPYTFINWNFKAENQYKLFDKMSQTDQIIFDFDTRKLDWAKFCDVYCLGIRKYVFKDDQSSLNRARSEARRKYAIQLILRVVFYLMIVGCVVYALSPLQLTSLTAGYSV